MGLTKPSSCIQPIGLPRSRSGLSRCHCFGGDGLMGFEMARWGNPWDVNEPIKFLIECYMYIYIYTYAIDIYRWLWAY